LQSQQNWLVRLWRQRFSDAVGLFLSLPHSVVVADPNSARLYEKMTNQRTCECYKRCLCPIFRGKNSDHRDL
ncbi:hypothetical protein ACHAXS_003080, partial [Conticribra weissflogii]